MLTDADAVDLALSVPLLASLDAASVKRVRAEATVQRCRPGDALLREGTVSAEIVVLVAGEAVVHRGGRAVDLITAPSVVGLLAAVDKGPRTADVLALDDAVAVHLPAPLVERLRAKSPAFGDALVRQLAGDVRGLYQSHYEMLQSYDDWFRSPNARLIPGPYRYAPFPAVFVSMEHDPAVVASWLPEGLRPFPGLRGRYFLVFSHIEDAWTEHPDGVGRRFSYHESAALVPCLDDRLSPGAFYPELYPDAYLPIALGREVYGFPKRFGRTVMGDGKVDLFVGNRLLLRVRWQGERAVGDRELGAHFANLVAGPGKVPGAVEALAGLGYSAINRPEAVALFPPLRARLHRQLAADAAADRHNLQVDQLVEVPFHFTHLTDAKALDGTSVEFFDRDHFFGGRALGGASFRSGFHFGQSTILRDYLVERQGVRSGAGRGLLRRWRLRT
jgi:hypothetical protein